MEQAALALSKGEGDPLSIFRRLDVGKYTYSPGVIAEKEFPLITTGTQGNGSPIVGELAFSIADIEQIHRRGKLAILVCGGHENAAPVQTNRNQQGTPDAYIVAFQSGDRAGKSRPRSAVIDEHAIVNFRYERCVLFDNMKRPLLTYSASNKTLQFSDGKGGTTTLRNGDSVTLDPISGEIWRGVKSVRDTSASAREIRKQAALAQQQITSPCIAFHLSHEHLLQNVFDLRNAVYRRGDPKMNVSVGLWKTESDLWTLCQQSGGGNILCEIARGKIPDLVRNRLGATTGLASRASVGANFRLVDIDAFLAPHSVSVETRAELYRCQISNAFGGRRAECPITIIIPRVRTAEETALFRSVVKDSEHGQRLNFGVMIELVEAAHRIAEIAPYCRELCIGTRDLTLDTIRREAPLASPEDAANGSVLSPAVVNLLKKAIPEARRANPNVIINMCGPHTDGEDIGSLEAALALGVDRYTVPTTLDKALRTSLAILRSHARQCSPQ